jgi:hypothetical protein
LLAFCHIEKAAGTSLIHILRRIYFLRYAAVRPLHSRDSYYFTARDLQTIKKVNPFLRAIGGHSVVPHGDLLSAPESLSFITQVREPVSRAASQYKFWVTRMKLRMTWEAFLKHPSSQNFQVKKIAGCEDLDLAKENISKHFLLVGAANQFDEFLVLLAKKLGMPLALFTYRKQNVDTGSRHVEMPDGFFDALRERNRLDEKLYEWIVTTLLASYVAEYSGNFSDDLKEFRARQQAAPNPRIKTVMDSIYRNAYLKPLSALIRVSNGLPYHGSYSIE